MPLGILEPKKPQEVPGTCLLTNNPNQKGLQLYKVNDVSALKHGEGKCVWISHESPAKMVYLMPADSDIFLVPQPLDDL